MPMKRFRKALAALLALAASDVCCAQTYGGAGAPVHDPGPGFGRRSGAAVLGIVPERAASDAAPATRSRSRLEGRPPASILFPDAR